MSKKIKKEWNNLEPITKLKDGSYLKGYLFCPKCGNKGELFEGIMMISVAENWEQETQIICPKCQDEDGIDLCIGWAGIKKGNRKDFFDDVIKSLKK